LKVFINGEFVPEEEAKVSVFDHGLLYGDGAFEGIRAYDGRVFKLDEHIARLYRSAHALLIELPLTQAEMRETVLKTLRINELKTAYIRITISRGVGLGLDPKNVPGPATVIIITDKLSLYPQTMYEKGLDVVTVSVRMPPAQALDPQIKSLGKYINNIMAKFMANQYGAGEGLMLTVDGHVAEATGDNLFIINKGVICTPPVSVGILEGITRNTVIDMARREGFQVEERMMTLYDVYNSDEAFLTGTAAEMIPMVKLDGRVIGDGRPGPVTMQLSESFRRLTREEGVPVW
jgi:branched-chain amino acid aminotransferase